MRSVKVSNISSGATEQDLREFLTFPGKIEHVEMGRFVYIISMKREVPKFWIEHAAYNISQFFSDKGSSKVAYVTFSTPEGAETAVLLSVDSFSLPSV